MAKEKVIFDSCFWIAYFNQNDTTHKKATNLLSKHSSSTIIISEYVLLEISTVLKLQLGHTKAQATISALVQTETIEVLPSADYFFKTLKLFLTSADSHLSFVDMSLLVLAKDFVIETFDKKLIQAIQNRKK